MSDTELLPPIDRENLFLLYSTFCGDVEKTAHAAGLRPLDVIRCADDLGWTEKLKPIFALKKSSAPGDIERGINRAIAFTQAHRLRMVLDRAIARISGLNDVDFDEQLFPVNKNGFRTLTTRALTDLAAAVEKCNAQAAQALSDTAQDRARRDEASEKGEASGGIHATIAAAMAAVSKDCSPRAQLVDAQLATAQQIIKPSSSKPDLLVDRDDPPLAE
jgi:hypothetical protein